jgi:TetR/AcrR family transcriptional repressor of bet genes
MAATAKNIKRTATREQRREQLIDATMKCIARKGMGSTTLGDVAKEAGLSQGIVNLHFKSKENLLNETLRYLADRYKTRFKHTLETSGPGAAEKMHALMALDLSRSILDRRMLAVWFAFWGEVKSRPRYRLVCEESDKYYDSVMRSLCDELIADGGYSNITSAAVATMLTSASNGMWLSYLISPKRFDRDSAANAVDEYLQSVFPKHFPLREDRL